jgi:hypothetical protein
MNLATFLKRVAQLVGRELTPKESGIAMIYHGERRKPEDAAAAIVFRVQTHDDFIEQMLNVPTRAGTRNRRFHNEHAEAQAMGIVATARRELPAAQWGVFSDWLRSHFGLSAKTVREWTEGVRC